MHSYYGASEYILTIASEGCLFDHWLVLHVQDAGSVNSHRYGADKGCMQVKSGWHVVLFSTSDANPDPWVGPQRQSKADLENLFSVRTTHPAPCLLHLALGLVHDGHGGPVICGDVTEDRVGQREMLLHTLSSTLFCSRLGRARRASHMQAL